MSLMANMNMVSPELILLQTFLVPSLSTAMSWYIALTVSLGNTSNIISFHAVIR